MRYLIITPNLFSCLTFMLFRSYSRCPRTFDTEIHFPKYCFIQVTMFVWRMSYKNQCLCSGLKIFFLVSWRLPFVTLFTLTRQRERKRVYIKIYIFYIYFLESIYYKVYILFRKYIYQKVYSNKWGNKVKSQNPPTSDRVVNTGPVSSGTTGRWNKP